MSSSTVAKAGWANKPVPVHLREQRVDAVEEWFRPNDLLKI